MKLMQPCPETDLSLYSSLINVKLLVLLILELHSPLLAVHGVSYAHSNGQTEKGNSLKLCTHHGGANRFGYVASSPFMFTLWSHC